MMINKTTIVLASIFALMAIMFRDRPSKTFAFDNTFPEDGSEWEFSVVMDEDSTALSVKEKELLDKLKMSPIFRCKSGFFGKRWVGRSLFSSDFKHEIILRMYKLVLEDTSPPDPNKFLIRHQILGYKSPLHVRHDEFVCADPKNSSDNVCKKWNSIGYVGPKFTRFLTDGMTSNPIYKQELKQVPRTTGSQTVCPLVKSSWWCLWVLCPSAAAE